MMPRPDDMVAGDIVVREFAERYLIWRVREQKNTVWTHERLGESDNQARAISIALHLSGGAHAVWFCDEYEKYRQISGRLEARHTGRSPSP